MPGEFDAYIEKFNAAKAAWAKLYIAVQDLYAKAMQLHQSPQILANPGFGTLPAEQQLREMLSDAQAKSGPLMIEYGKLPPDVKQYAPRPEAAAQKG